MFVNVITIYLQEISSTAVDISRTNCCKFGNNYCDFVYMYDKISNLCMSGWERKREYVKERQKGSRRCRKKRDKNVKK